MIPLRSNFYYIFPGIKLTFGVDNLHQTVRDLLEDSAVALACSGLSSRTLGLPQHDDPGDLGVDLRPDGQQLLSDLLQLLRSGGVGLDQLEEDAHDVHADQGQELLLVDSLAGADFDWFVAGSNLFDYYINNCKVEVLQSLKPTFNCNFVHLIGSTFYLDRGKECYFFKLDLKFDFRKKLKHLVILSSSNTERLTIFIYVFDLYLRAFVLVSIASLISSTWVIVSATVCSKRGRGSNKVSWRIISIFSLWIESNDLIYSCYSFVNVCLSFMRLLSVLNVSFLKYLFSS